IGLLLNREKEKKGFSPKENNVLKRSNVYLMTGSSSFCEFRERPSRAGQRKDKAGKKVLLS
ncbi:MAG: hypothetical protein P8O70_02110, partial [SAR324 cluster bacterium]|nr:hypothetical protein [SAR324 cluster bacterium]